MSSAEPYSRWAAPRGHGGHGGARPRQAADGPDPGPQRRHPGVIDGRTPADLHAVRRGGEFFNEAGLADPGRPADQDDATRARAGVGEPALQERQLLVPADQRIARRDHTSSIAARRSSVQVQYAGSVPALMAEQRARARLAAWT